MKIDDRQSLHTDDTDILIQKYIQALDAENMALSILIRKHLVARLGWLEAENSIEEMRQTYRMIGM